jgi:hypothetical protein
MTSGALPPGGVGPVKSAIVVSLARTRTLILGGTLVETVGRQIFESNSSVASGEKTKSERHDVGEEDSAPWSIGLTL